MIIGIVGMYASGKDTAANHLEKNNFRHYSLSDEIRAELMSKKIKITRDNLIKAGNELREKFGPSILAERVIVKINKDNYKCGNNLNHVVTSIRNPAELEVLREMDEFILVAVDADVKKRFEWLKERARENDSATFKEFITKEKIEQSSDPNKQQLHKVIKEAKIIIKNDGTLEELQEKINKLVVDLQKKFYRRPSWDEYFMGIVEAVSRRATCNRGRTAVVIVKDKQILVTGYVGSPFGQPHCDDAGHQMKKVVHEDGSTSQHCMRTLHAEANAVALAARNGVSVNGAALYCKLEPCYNCAKIIVNAGIKRVICQKRYHAAKDSRKMLKEAGVMLEVLDENVEKYSNQ